MAVPSQWRCFASSSLRAKVHTGWRSIVPSGWVQILRWPRTRSLSPKSPVEQRPTVGKWRNHQSLPVKPPAMPRQPRVVPAAARDLAKTRISKLERALEAMGGMEGPAAQAIKVELDKAKSASKRPHLNVEIEETRKFSAHSVRRLKEMEDEGRVEEGLLSEAQKNLTKMLEEQERGPQFPKAAVKCHCASDKPSADWEHASNPSEMHWRRSCNLGRGCVASISCTPPQNSEVQWLRIRLWMGSVALVCVSELQNRRRSFLRVSVRRLAVLMLLDRSQRFPRLRHDLLIPLHVRLQFLHLKAVDRCSSVSTSISACGQ